MQDGVAQKLPCYLYLVIQTAMALRESRALASWQRCHSYCPNH